MNPNSNILNQEVNELKCIRRWLTNIQSQLNHLTDLVDRLIEEKTNERGKMKNG